MIVVLLLLNGCGGLCDSVGGLIMVVVLMLLSDVFWKEIV